jgi:hypothetical protein
LWGNAKLRPVGNQDCEQTAHDYSSERMQEDLRDNREAVT